MFDIGFWELLLIGVMALLILGPERLPGALRSTIKTVRRIRQTATHFKNEVEQQLHIQELHENLKKAERQGLKDLAPDVQKSVDELRQAAESVRYPFKEAEHNPTASTHTSQIDDSQHEVVSSVADASPNLESAAEKAEIQGNVKKVDG